MNECTPTFRNLGEGHYVVAGSGDSEYGPVASKRLPMFARRFWTRHGLGECTQGVGVFVNKRLIAFFRYAIGGGWLVPGGTWVDLAWRRHGLALRMWLHALDRSKMKKVDVVTVSRGGSGLIRRLRTERPKIKFSEGRNW
jgi:hypothetical protein